MLDKQSVNGAIAPAPIYHFKVCHLVPCRAFSACDCRSGSVFKHFLPPPWKALFSLAVLPSIPHSPASWICFSTSPLSLDLGLSRAGVPVVWSFQTILAEINCWLKPLTSPPPPGTALPHPTPPHSVCLSWHSPHQMSVNSSNPIVYSDGNK